ncbi:prokaryotic cytochrome b561 [Mariprofundus micogutta]|uniref:Prokaryotic cytochrome b561 n=1 Tax=Mariprofundus micogutta TaxID=1921010 RepID=A0A1L8CKF9_9PROT|nr:cytochrome b/b6 domain-containing protein [Mariprofundus micogutta]GAV19386.1 prokaryotic cytochrome b561 [Mariprofundus micogutta]
MKHDRTIRILHIFIIITVFTQLLTELFMQVPKPGEKIDPLMGLIFSAHEIMGMVVLTIVIVYLMIVGDKEEHRSRLFPWLTADGRSGLICELKRDVPGWFKGILSKPEDAHLIAGSVHGLGIILAFLLGATGCIIYLGMKHDGSMPPAIKSIREFHELLGTTMWIFVCGHLFMATMHQIKGHRVLQAMFSGEK